jgi:hypothetical protein
MGTNKKYIVGEIRGASFAYFHSDGRPCVKFNADGVNIYTEPESKVIGQIINHVGRMLLWGMKGDFELENTNVISTAYVDSDSYQDYVKENMHRIRLGGNQAWNRIGFNILQMSRSHFHSLKTDEEKLVYIAECHYNSLVAYCKRFDQDDSELHKGIEILRKSDWYFPFEHDKYVNRKKTLKIWIQTLKGYELDTHRLAIKNLLTGEGIYIELFKIEPWVKNYNGAAELRGDTRTVTYFDTIGWKKGNIFYFCWGDEEKYEFHGDTMQLFKNGELVS